MAVSGKEKDAHLDECVSTDSVHWSWVAVEKRENFAAVNEGWKKQCDKAIIQSSSLITEPWGHSVRNPISKSLSQALLKAIFPFLRQSLYP